MAKIGLQLYTLRKYLDSKENIEKTLDKVYNIGYRTIQISGLKNFLDPEIVQVFKDKTAALGLDIAVTHIPLALLENNFEEVVKLHKLWKCNYVGIGSISPEIRKNPSIEKYYQFALKMEAAAQKLQEQGLKLVYHNHEFEFEKIDNKLLFSVLTENTKDLIFELDVYWLQRAGVDPVAVIKSLKNRIDVIHLKDYLVFNNHEDLRMELRYGEIGAGNLDIPQIIDSAIAGNCRYLLIEQDETYDKNEFDSVKISFDNLVEMGYEALLKK